MEAAAAGEEQGYESRQRMTNRNPRPVGARIVSGTPMGNYGKDRANPKTKKTPITTRHTSPVQRLAISTPRLVLAPHTADTLAAVQAMVADPYSVHQYDLPVFTRPFVGLSPRDRSNDIRLNQWRMAEEWDPHDFQLGMVVRCRECGQPLGEMCLHVWDEQTGEKPIRQSDIGSWAFRTVQGAGVIREAVMATTDFAFHQLGVAAIKADAESRNTPSKRVLARAGFAPIGEETVTWKHAFSGLSSTHKATTYLLPAGQARPGVLSIVNLPPGCERWLGIEGALPKHGYFGNGVIASRADAPNPGCTPPSRGNTSNQGPVNYAPRNSCRHDSHERQDAVNSDEHSAADNEGSASALPITLRPLRSRIAAWITAVIVTAAFIVFSTLLRGGTEGGGTFMVSDQLAMVGVGLFFSAGMLIFARPRVIADREHVTIRNLLGSHRLPWAVVHAVRFDDRSPWATLELADDDTMPIMALQIADKERALRGVRQLRALLANSPSGPA